MLGEEGRKRVGKRGSAAYALDNRHVQTEPGPTQLPNQRIPRPLTPSAKQSSRVVDHSTPPTPPNPTQLQPRLKIPEALPPLPHTSEWRSATNQEPSVYQINSTSSSTRPLTTALIYGMTDLLQYLSVKVVTANHLKIDEQPNPETSCVPNITQTMDNIQHNISTDLS
jgi:hypothetical protein